MEGRVTRFSSGIAGVAIVLFALMGTIGVGYLLNGTSGYENVNDYNYVTDVTGLYSYTPVPAYAEYSPATNNYQYSSELSTLGTYTSGINYTQAAAANLNPIITPDSGTQQISGSFSVYSESTTGGRAYLGIERNNIDTYSIDSGWWGTVSEYLALVLGTSYDTITLSTSVQDLAGIRSTVTVPLQQFGVIAPGTYSDYPSAYQAALLNKASAAYVNGTLTVFPAGTYTYTYGPRTYANDYAVGTISDMVVQPNGSVQYQYEKDAVVDYVSVQADALNIYAVAFSNGSSGNLSVSPRIYTFEYSGSRYGNVEYLDPNAGVSLSSSTVYWSNGTDLGSVTWGFQKPATASAITITPSTASGEIYSFTIAWTGGLWQLQYTDAGGMSRTVDLGSGWQAVYVKAYYTGELQVGPVERFFNFTNYTLGVPNNYTTPYSGSDPMTHCKISGSTSMVFACIETSSRTGVVPGAMYDGTFDVGSYFPQYTDVRISFDSAAYVGTSVQVDTWTMSVDSSSFYGQFIGLDNVTYVADLTQPWAITWNPGSSEVSITFTPRNEVGTVTATILNADVARAVTLNGQWVIDTDLYSVGTHVEEVFNWDFGNWGLDKTQFIVCAMGLTALLSIAFRLAHVPFKGLDYVVIFFGNLILWVVL